MAPCASKFDNPVYTSCGQISHPWCPDSCLKGLLMMMTSATLGSAPFVLLFYLVSTNKVSQFCTLIVKVTKN